MTDSMMSDSPLLSFGVDYWYVETLDIFGYLVVCTARSSEMYFFETRAAADACVRVFNGTNPKVYLTGSTPTGWSVVNTQSSFILRTGFFRTALILALFGKDFCGMPISNKWVDKFSAWENKFRDFLFILVYGIGTDK